MDKALKQRLVGASVLIALAVIILPMLLSGRPQGSNQQSQKIELPPRPDELSFETRRFPVNEQQGAGKTDDGKTTSPVNLQPPVSVQASEESAPYRDLNPEPVQDTEISATNTTENGTTRALADAAGHDQAPKDQGQVVTEQNPVANPPVTSSVGDGRFVVQVASFGSAENASRLMTALQQKNLPVLMDTIESEVGKLNRVRVGPFATESEASAVSGRIGSEVQGVRPRVVDLEPDQAADAVVSTDALVRWVVQAGSFAEPSNAETLVQKLRSDGLSAYSETLTTASSSIHRVRIGPFLERNEAIRTKQTLADNHSIDGVVMSAE